MILLKKSFLIITIKVGQMERALSLILSYHARGALTSYFYTVIHISYHTMPYCILPYYTLPYRTLSNPTILPYGNHTVRYHTMSYFTIAYHTIPYHTPSCHTITQHTLPLSYYATKQFLHCDPPLSTWQITAQFCAELDNETFQ